MTLQLRKKRQTIALMFNRETLTKAVALAGAVCLGANANAQNWQTPGQQPWRSPQAAANHDSHQQTVVPATHSVEVPDAGTNNWNLNWRQSGLSQPSVATKAGDVFAAGPVRVKKANHERSPVQQAHGVNAGGVEQADYFANPFGNKAQLTEGSVATVAQFEIPADTDPSASSSESAPPSLSQPSNQLRTDAAAPANQIELPPTNSAPSAPAPIQDLPAPAAAPGLTAPSDISPAAPPTGSGDAESSDLSEMLKDGPGTIQPSTPAPNAGNSQSPSDRDGFDNPFGRVQDEEDLQRLRERMEEIRQRRATEGGIGGGELGMETNETLSCEEFRQRINKMTIRDVSLDISPPFRPDVLSESDYQELKSEFDGEQSIRPWSNLNGEVIGTGRLIDLAYEKAVLVTESGSKIRLPLSDLSEGDLAYIAENWGVPRECRLPNIAFQKRNWNPITVTWKASNLCHKPLYFEDVNLERYGHTHGPLLEPVVQSAHFFANIAILPYKMGVHSPHECQYALGYYRPGSCAPWIKQPFPLSARGAVAQGATMTGLFWLIP